MTSNAYKVLVVMNNNVNEFNMLALLPFLMNIASWNVKGLIDPSKKLWSK